MSAGSLRRSRVVPRRTILVGLTAWIVAVETLLIAVGFVATDYLYVRFAETPPVSLLWAWALAGYLASALTLKLYSARGIESLQFALERIARSIGRAIVIVAVVLFLLGASSDVSRVVFGGGFASALVLLLGHRVIAHGRYRATLDSAGPSTIVIVDDAEPMTIAGALLLRAGHHEALRPDVNDPETLDRFAGFVAPYDHVVVACSADRRMAWANVLRGANVTGRIVAPELVALKPTNFDLHGDVGLLTVSAPGFMLHERAYKRALDLALVVPACIFLLPLAIMIAVAIKLDDGGPVLFRQRRIGRANRFFTMYKFRSMKVELLDHVANRSTTRDDDRVTRVGRLIRSSSVDELPQLLNILLGQMSVVGPRPHALGSRAGDALFWEVNSAYWHRHAVKPGLTGLAQVRGYRGPTNAAVDLENRLGADLEYVKGWTLWRDLVIILRTMLVLRHDNAF